MAHILLSEENLKIIEGTFQYEGVNSQLHSDHIEAFNKLMEFQYNISMISPACLQEPDTINAIDLCKPYIQILFSGSVNNGHWICIYYDKNIIHIYDSLNTNVLHNDFKIFLNYMFPIKDNLKIVYEQVQSQENSYDCGVFAIAFATCLLHQVCPCTVQFDIMQMRKHLFNIFDTNNIVMFPTVNFHKRNDNSDLFNFYHLHSIVHLEFSDVYKNVNINYIVQEKKNNYHTLQISCTKKI